MSLLENINQHVMSANGIFSAGNEVNVNSSDLKSISVKLKAAIDELVAADKEAHIAWDSAKSSLGPNLSVALKSAFEKTDNEYYNAIFLLNKYQNSLDRVSNIWGNAEERIMSAIRVADSQNNQ